MSKLLPALSVLLCMSVSAIADTTRLSALDAVKLLPKGVPKNLSRIEAREGKPYPDRWHILVHDPREESGVHEYVIAGDELISSRSVSQFAEALTSKDVIGTEQIRIDSDQASQLAREYAFANDLIIATIDYALMKQGENAVPLWKLTCRDDQGKSLGEIVMTATKGTIVSHEGFTIEPAGATERLSVQVTNLVAVYEEDAEGEMIEEELAEEEAEEEESTASKPKATAPKKKKTSTKSRSSSRRTQRPNVLRRAGGTIQKFFTGRNTIGR